MDKLRQEAYKIRMTPEEKAAMRARLFGAPSAHTFVPKRSPYFFFSYQFKMVMAGLVLVVFVGAGTAQAAEGSLPGDLLYPVKVAVTEPVRSALVSNKAERAALEARFAARRAEEAEALAAQGRLDATTSAALADNLDMHAEESEELAASAAGEEPGAAASVQTTLASTLSAHGAILKELGVQSSSSAVREHSQKLSARVLARAGAGQRIALAVSHPAPAAVVEDTSVQIRVQTFTETVPTSAPEVSLPSEATSAPASVDLEKPQIKTTSREHNTQQKGAAQLEEKAAELLAQAQRNFNEHKGELSSTTAAEVEAQFITADRLLAQGSLQLRSGDYQSAKVSFVQVLQLTARLSTLLKAQQKFDGSLIQVLIKEHEKGRED